MGKHFGLVEATLLSLCSLNDLIEVRLGHPVEHLGRMTLRPHLGMPMQVNQRVR